MSNQKCIQTRIKNRSDSQANWELYNPVLLKGEIAIVEDSDIRKLKVGNGLSAFNDLPYYSENTDIYIDNNKIDNLSIVHIQEEDFTRKVADEAIDLSSNILYVVDCSNINAYGQKIVNVANPSEDTDGANKQYVDSKIPNVKPLSGTTYDLSKEGDFTKMITDVAIALGATIQNNPFS